MILGLRILKTAPYFVPYLFFALTDLMWGANVLLGSPYQPHIPAFAIINTSAFGLLLLVLGVWGTINFFLRHKCVVSFHSWFNTMFYLYITAIFIMVGDSAWARNCVSGVLAGWVVWRNQNRPTRAEFDNVWHRAEFLR